MTCGNNCGCYLCLELKGCEKSLKNLKSFGDNFILKADNNVAKKFTFFGMEIDFSKDQFEKFSTMGAKKMSKHKSVIYINDVEKKEEDDMPIISVSEKIDEEMSVYSVDNSKVINVVFKNTFGYASQIINELHICDDDYFSDDLDDFPLGMEADMIRQYLENRR